MEKWRFKKIKHIIHGIHGEDSENSKVFNQFGKYLCDENELIIDQHVLRAFIFFKTQKIIKKIENKDYDNYLDDYKAWIKRNVVFISNKHLINEILFSIGKSIKPR